MFFKTCGVDDHADFFHFGFWPLFGYHCNGTADLKMDKCIGKRREVYMLPRKQRTDIYKIVDVRENLRKSERAKIIDHRGS